MLLGYNAYDVGTDLSRSVQFNSGIEIHVTN